MIIRVGADGKLHADVGPARITIAGRPVAIDVVVDSAVDAELSLTVAGSLVVLDPLRRSPATARLKPPPRR